MAVITTIAPMTRWPRARKARPITPAFPLGDMGGHLLVRDPSRGQACVVCESVRQETSRHRQGLLRLLAGHPPHGLGCVVYEGGCGIRIPWCRAGNGVAELPYVVFWPVSGLA